MEQELGFMIRKARFKKQWSVDEFIEALDIDFSPAYITRIEIKAEIPNEHKLIRIATLLDLDPVVVLDLAKKVKIKRFKKRLNEKHKEALDRFKESKQSPKAL